jgi:hypothetical protein
MARNGVMRVGVRVFCAMLLAASLLPGLAFAQASMDVGAPKKPKSPLAAEAEERRNHRKEVDKEYDAMRRNTEADDDKPVKVDPWANMRSPNDNQKR